jgi:hypothetical protein
VTATLLVADRLSLGKWSVLTKNAYKEGLLMDQISLNRVVQEKLNELCMPHRLNGFQIFFFEKVSGVRQYSTGLPKCKFRDEVKLLLDEMIQQFGGGHCRSL